MKQAKLMFFLLLSIGISAQEFSISDEAITFPNGKKLNNPVNSPIPIPGDGEFNRIFAEFSNGIVGDVTAQGYVGDVVLFKFDHHFYRETDDAGRPIIGGSVKKDQLVIYKKIDPSSADLLQKLSTNTPISEIIIKMVISGTQAGIETRYSLTLSNVQVIHHRYITEYNEDTETYYFYEKISLHVPSFEFKDVIADRTVNIN